MVRPRRDQQESPARLPGPRAQERRSRSLRSRAPACGLLERLLPALLLVVTAAAATGCGGGVPVRLRIDEFSLEVSLDDAVAQMGDELVATGFLPVVLAGLPEIWPDSLPDLQYSTTLLTEPVPIDLSPEPGTPEAEKYAQINDVKAAIRRIEINRVVLRLEQSTLSMPLPALVLEVADTPDADPADRHAWFPVGRLPSAPAGFVGDLELEFFPGGESFLNAQLGDEAKELAIRTRGRVVIDTALSPAMPRGKAALRLIVVTTFFVEAEKAL